jgi:hypothetical protein
MAIRLLSRAVTDLVENVAALTARLTAVEQLLAARTQGTGTVSAGLAGGTLGTAVIAFDKAMPDDTYKVVSVEIEGASGVSGVLTPILPATDRTPTGCKIGVKNNALLALAATATVRVTVEKLA